MVGTSRRGRGVPTYDPNNSFYFGGLLICFTFGMMLAGIHESFLAGDRVWFWCFVAAEAGLVVLYFWNVWCWLQFTNLSDDYNNVSPDVDSWDGYFDDWDYHYPGDR